MGKLSRNAAIFQIMTMGRKPADVMLFIEEVQQDVVEELMKEHGTKTREELAIKLSQMR